MFIVVFQFDWVGFVKAVVESKDDPSLSISSSEPVIVRTPKYFKDLMKLINSTDSRYQHLRNMEDMSLSLPGY